MSVATERPHLTLMLVYENNGVPPAGFTQQEWRDYGPQELQAVLPGAIGGRTGDEEIPDGVVGFIAWYPVTADGCDEPEVMKIWVREGYRRQGIASMLMDAFLELHKGLPVDMGFFWPDGRAWWTVYAERRELDLSRFCDRGMLD